MNKHTIIRFFLIIATCCTLYFIYTQASYASSYVLPYPSYMPGHVLYKPRIVWDKIQLWWHMGDIAKTKYHMQISDRYLIEAKTLFEYGQDFLAVEALKKSNNHFITAVLYVREVEKSNKDNGQVLGRIVSASQTHTVLLNRLLENHSEDVVWEDEKKDPVTLQIPFIIRQSLIIRSYANNT